ncbi:hypothetical protein Pmani_020310 [Petrolisthes manimaculis]|uniref:Uncharacterized protein n=1 Tax=Petrolisthes manimaculis TaxID=1843537 RepID=A0AAE1PGJ0_9EUCA|nr:hypothetical protein Pmani_020310 [Petrolisthes manimaculis]
MAGVEYEMFDFPRAHNLRHTTPDTQPSLDPQPPINNSRHTTHNSRPTTLNTQLQTDNLKLQMRNIRPTILDSQYLTHNTRPTSLIHNSSTTHTMRYSTLKKA